MKEDQRAMIQLTAHEHELSNLRHRLRKLEGQAESINKLTISVHQLAGSVREMLDVQRAQSGRLERLENLPAEEARGLRREFRRALCSAIAGALVGAIVTLFTHG